MLIDSIPAKTASIMICEASSGVRPMMTAALRELGFEKVTGVASLTEALASLATEPCDWLITSFFADDKVNALQLLLLSRTEPSLQFLKVSIFAAESERSLLPKAFAMGLFTCHPKPFNKDMFALEMSETVRLIEFYKGNSTLTAAVYLRRILKEMKGESDRQVHLKFAEAMNHAFPEEIDLILHLAEANFLAGNTTSGRGYLWQVQQRSNDHSLAIEELRARYLDETRLEPLPNDTMTLKTCIVIDPDTLVLTSLKETLEAYGAEEVVCFTHGDACFKWLASNPEPDLLLMEWRVPGLGAPQLLQRCRSKDYHSMAVIVQSSLIQKAEEPLLWEMGVNAVLAKPFRKDDFLNCIASTLGQWRRPTKLKTLEAKIRARLKAGEIQEASQLMPTYLAQSGSSHDATQKQLEAEFAFAAHDFSAARDQALLALRLGNRSVTLLNLLGKSLMRLGEHASALQVFQKANTIAPNSVTRLCAIAETQQELGDNDAARATLDQLNSIDARSQDVINTKVNIGLAIGDAELVESGIDMFEPSQSVLAYVNNKAIAYSRAGQFDDAIALYLNVQSVLPPDKLHLICVVGYNLGLAYARKGDLISTIQTLEAVPKMVDLNLTRKTLSLLDRAKSARDEGIPLQLFLPAEPTAAKSAGKMKPSIDRITADLIKQFKTPDSPSEQACCYGLFEMSEPDNDEVSSLLAKTPHFQARQAIKKG